MLSQYFAIAVLVLLAFGLAIVFVAISHLFGPKRPSHVKLDPYECGVDPVGDARSRFRVKFYLIALVFVLFDIETVFLVPWAVIYRSAIESWGGLFIFWEMLVFVAILGVGLLYIWKKGALEWD
jgi:NADH-quinone oxidoreductase subunit A